MHVHTEIIFTVIELFPRELEKFFMCTQILESIRNKIHETYGLSLIKITSISDQILVLENKLLEIIIKFGDLVLI